MTGSGAPCGACKFLRRKCVRGCVFAPYFCHEQGATHFAAIHKVFGASNVSKLLAHLPVSDRCEAAVTISYEAQARLQDPIYGCVSHIFALQQQVFLTTPLTLFDMMLSISSRSLLLSRNKHLRALLMALLLQTLMESFLLSSKMFKAGSTQIIQAWH
ncbi:hypothetical protein Goshw_007406 [Gossypium schwendimanii]|uniref:LOB domain-containing protein n=4 Tax=Gossypium TaxID=3633 RepID=A0A7J9BZN3_GOSGO|nr:hypothetical protein [Gossypium davidsonii]MBA0741606.1 hypothetical protein [Gossypium gossypioides]MBA0769676.1 hypothetical protein [Gossypium trilobum]MBA0859493.1 hypothetical protein [Gossypium schwendimanii]